MRGSETFEVRSSNLDDALGIAEVHVQSWKETYQGIVPQSYLDQLSVKKRASMWKKLLTSYSEKNISLVALDESERVIGFVDGGAARDQSHGISGELCAIYLLRQFHGRGLGQRLFTEFGKRMDKAGFSSFYLWVLERNPTALFYEKMGGVKGKRAEIDIGGVSLAEVMYSWRKI